MKTKYKMMATAITAALALAAGAFTANAETSLRLATAAPQGSPWANQLDRLAADVDSETDGDVKIEVFYNAQLGSEQDVTAQVARGRIDMAFLSNVSVALQVPEAIMASMYFYFDSGAQRECVMDNHLLEPIRELAASKGMYLLGWGEVGGNHVAGTTEVRVPADMAGKKLALATSKIANAFWETYGVIPTPMPLPEQPAAIQTGLIDFMTLPAAFYVPSGINKAAPVYSLTRHSETAGMLMMSTAVRDGLTEEQRAGIDRAVAKVPASTLRKEINGVEGFLINKHREGGGTVVELTDEERAQWLAPMADFYGVVVEELGDSGARLMKLMDNAKATCGQ